MPGYNELLDKPKVQDNILGETLRKEVLDYSKQFKRAWVKLGQHLHVIHRDKYYHAWGYDKFEYYTDQEVGIKKQTALRLLKAYAFVEEDEPNYIREDFAEARPAVQVPGPEEINVLRAAKTSKHVEPEEYKRLKKAVFEKGQPADLTRKDLTAMIRERKQVDPEEAVEERNQKSIQKLIQALAEFKKDAVALKTVPDAIIEEAEHLKAKLETGKF